jgi:hypothetical protein
VEDIGSEELLSGCDEQLSNDSDLDVDDAIAYESDTLSEDLQTIEEMLEDLQVHLGPGPDEEFWRLRTLVSLILGLISDRLFLLRQRNSH